MKKVFNDDPVFNNSRVVYSVYDNEYPDSMNKNLANKLEAKDTSLAAFSHLNNPTFDNLNKFAMEISDVVILRNDLHSVFIAWKLSQAVIRKIKQNLFFAFAYNMIGIPIAMGVLYPFNGYLLNPMIAGMAMAFSSVSVVVNTLKMKFYLPTFLRSFNR